MNEADSINHDHGDHMVENFKLISEALGQKKGSTPSEQLAFASEKLSQSATTGSAKVYSEGLTRAANQLQGQSTVTADNALSLVQSLLGGASAGPSALPGTRGITRRGASLGSLLTAGSAFMQAKQAGDSPVAALLKAVMAGSQMKEAAHQNQSGQVVGGTLINVLTTHARWEKAEDKTEAKTGSEAKGRIQAEGQAQSRAESQAKAET